MVAAGIRVQTVMMQATVLLLLMTMLHLLLLRLSAGWRGLKASPNRGRRAAFIP
jgi:hypothetical protein